MSFSSGFTELFYTGAGSATDVPDRYDVAINGHGFMLDTEADEFKQGLQTIPLLRPQTDTSSQINASAVNPDDLWPRTQQSWHHGAGQEFLDQDQDADSLRFWRSFGIDPWTQGKLKTLQATRQQVTSVNTNLAALQAGSYTYFADGTALTFSTDVGTSPTPTFISASIHAGESAAAIASIATDGNTIYAALAGNGVHKTTRGATSGSHFNDLTNVGLLGYVKSRLMAAVGPALYNITTSGAAPTALFTHANPDWTWVGFAEGPGSIYAAGYSGDKSLIYRTAVVSDGTTLGAPVVAGELPDGEVVRAIQGYLGFVVVGTDKGFRLATADQSGNLTFGALVAIPQPVRCFEPQDRFIWFGWSNWDGTYTGLGRMDLSVFTAPNVPAYTSDLMASAQGNVTSVATSSSLRVFTVQGSGLWCEYTASNGGGWLESGKLDYGLGDNKIALRLKLRHQPLDTDQSVRVELAPDGGAYSYVGDSSIVGSTGPGESFRIPSIAGRTFQVRISLTNGAVVERYDLQSYPSTYRRKTIIAPILLSGKIQFANGDEEAVDPWAEYEYIESFVGSNAPVNYQELGATFTVFIEEVNFQRKRRTDGNNWWAGTAVVKMKALGD